jgi:hypothetical protein
MDNRKTFILWLAVVSVITIAILAIITFDFYPIAFVNFRPIMAYRYLKSLDVAKKYYGNIINVSDASAIKILKKAVLEGLIDEVAIDNKLRQKMSSSEIEEKINSQMQEIISDPEIVDGLSKMSISVDEAKKYFLSFNIKNTILSGQLQMEENKQLIDWIKESRKNLKVIILMKGVHWTKEGVEFD